MSAHALRDVRFRTRWKRGPAADSDGGALVSYTEFTPDSQRDVAQIYFAAERLREAIAGIDGALGVLTWWQPLRRRIGSVSAWEDEAALRRFIGLPYHVEIMRRYRTRGSLRAVSWRTERFDLAQAFRDGLAALDRGEGRQDAPRGRADAAASL